MLINRFGKIFFGLIIYLGLACSAFSQSVVYTGNVTSSNDHAVSDGANTSVDADLGLRFTMGNVIALALHDGTSFTSHPYFNGVIFNGVDKFSEPSVFNILFDGSTGDPDYNDPNLSRQGFFINGAIYMNTDNVHINYTNNSTSQFVHQNDPSSWVTIWKAGAGRGFYRTDTGQLTHFNNKVISASDLQNSNYVLRFSIHRYVVMSTLTATDRAGKYWGQTQITVTVL